MNATLNAPSPIAHSPTLTFHKKASGDVEKAVYREGSNIAALANERAMTLEEAQNLVQIDDKLAEALRLVNDLDFKMIKRKLEETKGWTPELCDEIEELYRKFLALNLRYPGRKICPSGPIDDFWHAHILDTRAYVADCDKLFGGLLHHYPYFGMRGREDREALEEAFSDSVTLFIVHFGIDPTAGDTQARSCTPQNCP